MSYGEGKGCADPEWRPGSTFSSRVNGGPEDWVGSDHQRCQVQPFCSG